MQPLLIGAAGWLALMLVFIRGLPGTFAFEDGPELLSCAAGLGNTHPPGYPLLSLAGRLALVVPVGAPAFRMNLFVAGCAALAAVVLGRLGAALAAACGVGPRVAVWAGVFTAGAWALGDAFWWEALIGDKYGPYYFCFTVLAWLSWRALRAEFNELPRALLWLGAATGAAFAHHQFALFALPAVAVAAGRAGVLRVFGARLRLARIAALVLVLAALPLSVKALYPPIRSAGAAVPDWSRPGTFDRFRAYATGELYRGVFRSTSLPEHPRLATGRVALAWRLLGEEYPWPLWIAAPAGLLGIWRAGAPGFVVAVAGCAALNAAWAMNFSEKIVRWWVPAYGLLLAVAAAGWARVFARARPVVPAVLAATAIGVQLWRGAVRNDLSRFTAAHDLGRHLLASLPADAGYLGAGDWDLFPVWALQATGGARPDVIAAGLGGFVDPVHAATGGEARLLARAGVTGPPGPATFAALWRTPAGSRLRLSGSGYDRQLQQLMPFLAATEVRGLTGRIAGAWSPAAGAAASRRAFRAMTMRNLTYAPAGALRDLRRVRDEVARAALLQYPATLATLGRQCLTFGLDADAAWAFARARRGMEALAGPVAPPPVASWLPPLAARARRDAQAVALGYRALADVFEARGVTFLADGYRENAAAVMP